MENKLHLILKSLVFVALIAAATILAALKLVDAPLALTACAGVAAAYIVGLGLGGAALTIAKVLESSSNAQMVHLGRVIEQNAKFFDDNEPKPAPVNDVTGGA